MKTTTNLPRGRNKRAPYVRLTAHLPEMHARFLAGATLLELARKYHTRPDSISRALRRFNPALSIRRPRYVDETGKRYGRLTVRALAHSKREGNKIVAYFVCVCACGNVKNIAGYQLRLGRTKSCGCKKTENKRRKLF